MATIDSFSLPGKVDDLPAGPRQAALHELWQQVVGSAFGGLADFEQLYDPSVADTPADAVRHPVPWFAFPARLNRKRTTAAERNELADESRDEQDEYCEWSVEREGDEIVGVTFTTEVPEYWSALWRVAPDTVLDLYRHHVSPDVQAGQLERDGNYDPNNVWNVLTDGPIMHLRQENNNLGAALVLAAQATELRQRHGRLVTDQQDLVECGGLGNPFRSSDPQIASAINGLAALGNRITLTDPLGLYIDRIETGGMRFPAGVTAADCWHIERGTPDHTVRARFAVPRDRGTVSDVTAAGTPITSGAQLADRVVIRIEALTHSPGSVTPVTKGCGGVGGAVALDN